jgi:hypothetical protein
MDSQVNAGGARRESDIDTSLNDHGNRERGHERPRGIGDCPRPLVGQSQLNHRRATAHGCRGSPQQTADAVTQVVRDRNEAEQVGLHND